MKPSFLLWIAFTFLATSCSTLMHQRKVYVNVATDADPATLHILNSDRSYITPVTFDLERSKADVNLVVDNDSDEVQFVLKSHLSSGFILGNLFNGSGLVGYAVDLTNPKRFTYPENTFVSFANNTSFNKKKPKRWTPTVKNQVNLKIAIPEGNHFYLNKGSGYGSAFGFLGISAGVEYFYTNRNSVNMDIGTMTDFLVPFPAPVDYEGGYDQSFATYADLQLGRDFGAFHFDYGVQANMTSYYERETVELFPEYIDTLKYSVQQYNAGIALSGYYTLSNHFQLGFNYYPSAFTWHKGQFDLHYSHLMMFELIFRLRAIRPGKP